MPAILGNIDISKMFLGSSEIVKAYLGEEQIFSSTEEVDSFLYSWGDNANGRTGFDTTSGNTLVPTQVGSASNWSTVSASFNHSLAINTDGELFAFGSNFSGRTGLDTDTGNTLVPTRVGIGSNWSAVSAGFNHSLALTADNGLWAWGQNNNGRTGLDTDTGNTLVPTRVSTVDNWSAASAGTSHSLVINTDGELFAFGSNSNGRTGLDTTSGNTLIPTRVGSANNWSTVSAGGSHSLAINTDGELFAWGQNTVGRTGLDTTTGNTLVPTRVGTANNWSAVAASSSHSLAINTDGELYAWGQNDNGRTGLDTDTGNTLVPTRVGTANNWSAVSSSGLYSLAINTDGELFAWGDNRNGRTGLNTTTGNTLVPTQVGTANNWSFIAAGVQHGLAVETIT